MQWLRRFFSRKVVLQTTGLTGRDTYELIVGDKLNIEVNGKQVSIKVVGFKR